MNPIPILVLVFTEIFSFLLIACEIKPMIRCYECILCYHTTCLKQVPKFRNLNWLCSKCDGSSDDKIKQFYGANLRPRTNKPLVLESSTSASDSDESEYSKSIPYKLRRNQVTKVIYKINLFSISENILFPVLLSYFFYFRFKILI